MTIEGADQGTFAEVESPTGLLYLAKYDHVAVASQSGSGTILFFNLEDYRSQGTLGASDFVAEVPMFFGASYPRFVASGEFDNEFIFTTPNLVMRACVPLANANCKQAIRNQKLVQGGTQFWGVGTLLSKGTLIVIDRQNIGGGILYECSLSALNQLVSSQCSVFADKPESTFWDPMALLVDEDKQMMYVSDNQFAIVHLFGFDGSYGGHVEENKGFLISPSSLAMKPGEC